MSTQKQVNIRVRQPLYEGLERLARQQRRSVPQTAQVLLEEGLRHHGALISAEDTPGAQIAPLAVAGGGFDWLAEEPEIYDVTSGEAVE